MRLSFTFLLVVAFTSTFSQRKQRPAVVDTLPSVTLDSVLVVTAKKGLTEQDFINQMLNDTMFYQAFRDMKNYSFIAENSIATFNEKHRPLAKIYRKLYHNNTGPKYKQEVLEARDSGSVYKRSGDFDLYTVRMFSYIFMNDRNTDFINASLKKGEKGEEGYKQKLKTLIFTPGKPVKGIPLVSDKTRIFDSEFRNYYNYTFHHATYQDSIPVYRFKCIMKPELRKSKQDDVMIKELTTIFDKRNFNILGRYIDMSYTSIPFDFDVRMNIELTYIEDNLLPARISYTGFWDIPFKQAEDCTFNIRHYRYHKK